ncbi:MAG: hypothetical protein H6707_00020 [Deltaproteobacteria bacterium]|nr:hypothetical protein [Deltaproteobacteria bacterium]
MAEDRFAQLEQTLATIEARLERIERRLFGASQRAPLAEPGAAALTSTLAAKDAGALSSQRLLSSVAVISFIFVVALIFRAIGRAGWLAPSLGIALGLGYCAVLLLLPCVKRASRRFADSAALIQSTGVLLAAMIVLEGVHRGGALGVRSAAIVLLLLTAVAGVVAALRRCAKLATAMIVVIPLTLAGLGLSNQGILLRAAGGLLLVGFALLLADRCGRSYLRLLAIIPTELLAVGIQIAIARRAEVPAIAPWALAGLAVSIWLATLANYLARAKHLSSFERVLPTITMLIAVAVFGLYRWEIAATSGFAAALTLVIVGRLAKLPDIWRPGALVGWLCCLWVGNYGLGCALFGLFVQLSAEKFDSAERLIVIAIALTSAACASHRLFFGAGAATAALTLIVIGGFCAVWLVQWRLFERRAGGQHSEHLWGVPLLLAALLGLFAFARRAVALAVVEPQLQLASQTLVLALGSLLLLFWGRRKGARHLVHAGLLVFAVLAIKVLLVDMLKSSGAYLVASVLVLGITATMASLSVRAAK